MKKITLLSILLMGSSTMLFAQSLLSTLKPKVSADLIIGPTISFSYGEFIDEQRTFSEVSYPDAEIHGSIRPRMFFSLGGQARLSLFEEGLLSKFSASLGLFYYQRGFSHRYSFDYKRQGLDITDQMNYTERYQLNHLGLPMLLRYEDKWMVELGLIFSTTNSGKRVKKLTRSMDGDDALDGGFSTNTVDRFIIEKDQLAGSTTSIMFNVGRKFNDRFSLRLTNHFNGKSLINSTDFKSYNLQLHLIVNLFNYNINANGSN